MGRAKLQIELNNHPYSDDRTYVAICMRGGYATRNYIIDNDSHFVSNYAFYNVLFNYYQKVCDIPYLHFDVQRAVSSVTFSNKSEDIISALSDVFNIIFSHEYDSEVFDTAKKTAKQNFALMYKDGEFRSLYKGYEFSDLNKCFSLKNLIEDIENISFKDFVLSAQTLLVPENMCIYISGKTDELDFGKLSVEKYADLFFRTVRIAGFGFDPFLRQDAHIINVARKDCNLIIEAFDFLNKDVTNFTKQLIVEMLSEALCIPAVDVWIDSLDASVMFNCDKLDAYKEKLSFDDEEAFNAAKEHLIKKYILLSENNPECFVIKAASLMTVGVYIDRYLSFLDTCSYELFNEICEKADYKISEGQIILKKESV